MSRPSLLVIADPRKWKVALSAIRIELTEMLRCIGPCTIAELAQQVQRPADTLYRQVDLLEKAGFVVRRGFRKNGRHAEQLFDVAADDFRPALSGGTADRGTRDALIKTARVFMRAGQQAVADSAAAGRIRLDEGERNLAISYELGWLDRRKYAEVRALLLRVKELMDQAKRVRTGELFLLVNVLTPVTRKHRRAADGAEKIVSRKKRERRASGKATGEL